MVGEFLNRQIRITACGAGAAMFLFFGQFAAAQSQFPPLDRTNFTTAAAQGFGDRQNSWAWSMTWYKNKLYVGTNRAMDCVTKASVVVIFPTAQYPPTDPDVACTPNYQDLPLQAEIWSWDPNTSTWSRVFQSPNDVPIPNTSPQKFTARDIGFRGMSVFTESDGTQALYVGGCSAKILYPSANNGRLLRSTDGVHFTPVPADPGTSLANLANTCFRGITTFNNKMYLLAGNFQGAGVIVESADPKSGNNSFVQVSPNSPQAYELAAFTDNIGNHLYVTFTDPVLGFSVGWTDATGTPPYQYNVVISNGGGKNPYPNPIALSMKVFQGRLYVGGDGVQHKASFTAQGAELFRINPDFTYDLLAGSVRTTSPTGLNNPNPLSGLGIGMGWQLNDHFWRQEIFDNRLYIGTFDDATTLRNGSPSVQQFVAPELGFDLWYTSDGAYYFLVDQNGFEDKFNFGVRSLIAPPSTNPSAGLFLGTANWFYGLNIYRGIPTQTPALGTAGTNWNVPQRLQVEGGNGTALLSWNAVPNVKQYHVYRYTLVSNTAVSAPPGSGPVTAPVLYEEIGTNTKPYFADQHADPNAAYGYQVKAEDAQGNLSGASNYVRFPSSAPPVTFSQIQGFAQQSASRGNFAAAGAQQQFFNALTQAQQAAQGGDLSKLTALWQQFQSGSFQGLKSFAAGDLEIQLNRLANRATLAGNGLLTTASLISGASSGPGTSPPPATAPTAPGQPGSGPAGSNYLYGGVTTNGPYYANNRTQNPELQYYILEPAQPAPSQAPVILFVHGWNALTTANYQAWLNHMVQKGYIVVWVKYMANLKTPFGTLTGNAQSAWVDALYRLQNFTWEKHVRPQLDAHGKVMTAIVGHSFGGYIAASLAGNAPTAIPPFPSPLAVVSVEPASLGLLTPGKFSQIDPNTKLVEMVADQDQVACSADALSIWNNTSQIPAANKNFLFLNTDTTGTPNQVGNHWYPNTDGYHDTAAIDTRDFYVTWKLSVAAAACAFTNQFCDYALGNGSPNQVSMGTWSNGVAVTPLTLLPDPNIMPPITGCAPPPPPPAQ